jgi:hypothetical protein
MGDSGSFNNASRLRLNPASPSVADFEAVGHGDALAVGLDHHRGDPGHRAGNADR